MGRRKGIGGDLPSLDVAQKYTLLARWYILAGNADYGRSAQGQLLKARWTER